MADGNITVEVRTQAAQAELERLRAENAALKREAHAWWTAARDATGEVERLREVAARLVAGIDHLDKLARDDRQALEAYMTGVLIVFWGALWGTFGTEFARGFIEAQLRGMEPDMQHEKFTEPQIQ